MKKKSVNDIIAEIRRFRLQRKWSLRRLADEAGLSPAALNRMDRDTWNPNASTIVALESVIRSTRK